MKVHFKNGKVWNFKYSNQLEKLAYETPEYTYVLFVEVNSITDEIDIMLGRQPKEHTECGLTGFWDFTEIVDFIEMPHGSIKLFRRFKCLTKRRKAK